jgi:hypothetical protein
MRRLLPLFAVALLAAALFATVARAELTPSQYRTQATCICVRAHQKLNSLPGGFGSRTQAIRFLTTVLPIERAYFSALERLSPPRP